MQTPPFLFSKIVKSAQPQIVELTNYILMN